MTAVTPPPIPGTQAITYGHEQPEYDALPARRYIDGCVLTEWELTEEERTLLIQGERIRLFIWTHGDALQPVALVVTREDQP